VFDTVIDCHGKIDCCARKKKAQNFPTTKPELPIGAVALTAHPEKGDQKRTLARRTHARAQRQHNYRLLCANPRRMKQ
jgi:hypothetical protein